MRDDTARLQDILDAIERIQRHAPPDEHAIDEVLETYLVHHLQIIGEAARGVSDGMRGTHPEVPWREIIAMRHILVHQYFEVDRKRVWQVVNEDLIPLKRRVEAILRESAAG